MIDPLRMAKRLLLQITRLSRLAYLNHSTMTAHLGSPVVQAELGRIAGIIARAPELAGDEDKAIVWFKHQPPAGFGKTAEKLVEDGHTGSAIEYLNRIAAGVHF